MIKPQLFRPADLLRYGLWTGVLVTARRNRRAYGVPTAWLTHLAGNSVTLLLPDLVRLLSPQSVAAGDLAGALLRTLRRRVVDDPSYAGYVTPLALGFIASHADYSIYHGRWAELTILGFGLDSVPHATTAYALARLLGETALTFDQELPARHRLHHPVRQIAGHIDALAALTVLLVTIIWEVSEYLAHEAELATGRAPEDLNMQWSLPDAITDTISNALGLSIALLVGHSKRTGSRAGLPQIRFILASRIVSPLIVPRS